jgi:predicted RNase H-like HicB family nuclease
LEAIVERHDYPILIEPLPDSEGGGFLATVPDLPGSMSDGQTREDAARNIVDAIAAWIEEARQIGRAIPKPSAHLALAGE